MDKLAQDRRPTIDLKLAADEEDELKEKPNFTTNDQKQEVLLCPSPTNESTTTADLTFENEEEEVPLWVEEDEVDPTPSLETTSVDEDGSSSFSQYEEEQVNNPLPPPAAPPISPLPSPSPLATVRKSFFSSWRRPSLNLEQHPQHQYTLGDHLEYLHISHDSTSSSSNLYFTDIGHLSPMQSSFPNIVKEYISQPSQEQLNAMYFVSEQSSGSKEEQHAENAPLPIRTLSIRLSPEAASSSSTSLLERIEASCSRQGKVLKKTPTMLQMHLSLPEEQSSVVLDVRPAVSKTTCSPERHVLLRLYFPEDIPGPASRSGSPLHSIVESDEEEYGSDNEEEEEEDLHESSTASVDRLGESCSSILSSSSTSTIPPQTIISTLKESSSLLQLLQQPGQTLESLCPSSSVQGTSKWLLQNFDLQASSKEQDSDTTMMAFPILCIADSMILHASDHAICSILESIAGSMYADGPPSDMMICQLDPVFDWQLQSMSHANMMGRLHDAKGQIQYSMRPIIENLLELQGVVHAAYSKFFVKLPSSRTTKMPTLVLPSLPSFVSDHHHRTTEAITSSSVQEFYQQIISRHDGQLEAYIQALNMAYLHHIDALRAILSKDIQTLECLAPAGIADITAQALWSGKQDDNNNDSAYHVPLLQLLTTTSTSTSLSPREKRRLPHRCWITGTHVLLLGRNDTTQIYELGDPRVTWKDQQDGSLLELTVVANEHDPPLTVQLQPQDQELRCHRTCASRSLGTVLDTLLSLGLMDAEDTIFDM